MAAGTQIITFDVQEAAVYPVTADISGGITYGAKVVVPGIQEASVEPNLVTQELKGDAKVLAKRGKVDKLNFSCSFAVLSLDALKVIFDASVVASGTLAAEKQTYKQLGGSLPYFKVEFLLNDIQTQNGDTIATAIFRLHKCQLTGGSIFSASTDNFSNPSFQAEAVIPTATSVNAFMEVVLAETAESLSA